MATTRTVVLVLLASSAAAAQAAAAQQAPTLEEAMARYEQVMERKVFRYHTDGRDKLAQTRDPAALEIPAKDYKRPVDYEQHARYQIATLIGRHFQGAEFAPALRALREAHDDPEDTWLWVQLLRREIDALGDDQALAIARDAKKPHERAAAIAALGISDRGDLKSAIVANCASFPRRDGDRMLVLGAMTGALWEQRKRVNTEEYREALRAYIGLLGDDVDLEQTAKVQMARHLQWILNGPAQFVNPEPWLELLERGDVKKPTDVRTSAQPRFFGIETEGERFCYVVDMSGSMCKEIDPDARPRGPITGPKPKRSKRSMVLDESDLPWHAIRTRWDLAREQLRISLSRLSSDKHFSIVWFGDEAGTLDATPGLVKATRGNIKRALDELDAIAVGPPTDIAPDGRLRGKTALHSGLRLAFGLAGRGFVEEAAYVAKGPLTEGCDTVFLLSDGAPSWDGFPILDKDYGEDLIVRDTEYAEQVQRSPQVLYHGPYVDPAWILDDLRRMNAFRRIRLHCVGLGEANEDLLRRLAEIGRGEVFLVGRKK